MGKGWDEAKMGNRVAYGKESWCKGKIKEEGWGDKKMLRKEYGKENSVWGIWEGELV
jgi:hypothetical protein